MRFLRSALCVVLLLAAAPLFLRAQQSSGVLTGTVHDETNAVIQGASVVLSGNGIQNQTTATDALGTYKFSNLPAGSTYTLVITAPGFKQVQNDYVGVTLDQPTELEVTLSPAGAVIVEQVQGSGGTQVETENAEQSGTITEKQVVTFGLNGRNFTQMITLAAGVSNQTGQDEAKVGVAGSAKYSVNGGRVEYNAFDVDGSDVLNTSINAGKGKAMPLIVYPSLDAIAEVKVLTSNYGAQYGRSASGSVLVTTKSGTSEFHGNGYEFLRNEIFNARNYFDETPSAPLYRKNDFGATIGGPLYIPGHFNKDKKKTFFFFSEEDRLEESPDNARGGDVSGQFNQAVPTDAQRGIDANGNFTGIANFNDGITCPFITGNSPSNLPLNRAIYPDCPTQSGETLIRNQFSINGVASTILNTGIFPRANSTAGCNSPIGSCFATTVSPSTTWREELFRIDHNISEGEKLGFRFIHDAWSTTVVSPEWSYLQGTNSFPSVFNHFSGPGMSLVARLDQIFSPTFLNQISVSYTDTHIMLTDAAGNNGLLMNGMPQSIVDLTRPAADVLVMTGRETAGGDRVYGALFK